MSPTATPVVYPIILGYTDLVSLSTAHAALYLGTGVARPPAVDAARSLGYTGNS